MGSKAFGILLLVVVIGVVVFVMNSGIFGKLKDFKISAPGFSPSGPQFKLGRGPEVPVPPPVRSPSPPSQPQPQPQPRPQPPQGGGADQINPADIPPGFTVADLSYFFHKIRIGSVSGNPYPGSVYFSLNSNFSDPVDVTGWLFKAKQGGQYVAKAINTYNPLGSTPETDIVIRSGDTVNFYPSQSAIGSNLRMNKCIGYLQWANSFNPSLPNTCPRPERRDVEGFSGACQDYALSLGTCALPSDSPPIPQYDYACRSYLNTLNYRGCFDAHVGEADFLGNEWRVWIGPSQIFDPRHDTIDLFDKEGKLVDERTY